MTIDQHSCMRRITPFGQDFFFGYYDNPAFSANGRYHLVHRPPFIDRLQSKNDRCEFGFIDLFTNEYHQLGSTHAWNFQQGSMLQWNQLLPNEEVLFNDLSEDGFCTKFMNIRTRKVKQFMRPVANVSSDGRYGVSINFSRLYDFRPGYGYAAVKDPYYNEPASRNDGVFLIHMQTGKTSLILSMYDIAAFLAQKCVFYESGQKLLINHITISPRAKRLVLLVRNFPDQTKKRWNTYVITCDLNGNELRLINRDNTLASHYFWKDDEHILFFSGGPCGNNLYVIDDETDAHHPVDEKIFTFDGHCSYSKDRRWILYDSYPIRQQRHLYMYDTKKQQLITLFAFYSDPKITGDIRCDLHPRWNADDSMISVDSIHEGFRGVYTVFKKPKQNI